MALTKQQTSKKMSFGEHRDIENVVKSKLLVKQKRVNVNFNEETHVRFKAACVKKGLSISDVIKNLVDSWLNENEV